MNNTINKDRKITLQTGEQYNLKLSSLAMAGYLWEFEVDNLFVAATEKKASEPPEKKQLGEMAIGGSYDEDFTIYGVNPGETKVTFTQSRPFEFGPPYCEHTVYITVI
jgi:predicted secreted protein